MRSDIYGTEIDNGLQTIVESMHTTAEIAAQALAEDDASEDDETTDTDTVEETGCNTAEDVDKFECPKCGELIQAAHCNK